MADISIYVRRCVSILLAALLIASPTLAQNRGSFTYGVAYETAAEARLLALECMKICGFSSEYSSDQQNALVRWTDRIYVQAKGSPTWQDLEDLRKFLAELGMRVPEMPGIFMTDRDDQANVTIYYAPLSQLPDLIPGYVENNWGFFYVWWTNAYKLYKGTIGIATDVTTQQQRNHLMREELVGVLGLCNDHDLYEDSILYQPWTEVQTLSELDWLMLNMLYSPSVRPGMTYGQVYSVMENRYFR